MTAETPEFIQVLRIDHVDDGQYKGDFIWGIVDTDNLEIKERCYFQDFPYSAGKSLDELKHSPNIKSLKLKVKEKQTILISGYLLGASETDGEIFVHYLDLGSAPFEETIVLYKTGQEITEDVDKLDYLGLGRLWIGQELAVYVFAILSE